MDHLEKHLSKQGYSTCNYDYPSEKYKLLEHGLTFHRYIEDLLIKNSGVKLHIITHSLGGIVARDALSKLNETQLHNIGCLIMLAPPNKGVPFSKVFKKLFPKRASVVKPIDEISSDRTAYVHQVPVPKVKIGIIAGRFDAKTPPFVTHLKEITDRIVINTTHTRILNNSKAKKAITHFLQKGQFFPQLG